MQLSLYRAERPEVFDDIIGQKQIVKILQNQIKNGSVSQAYLFTGTHGTGKTSTARILAKAVNCIGEDAIANNKEGMIPCGECENCKAIKEGRFVDVIELDAASNNGVEDLRAIIELVKYPPTIGKYKVYIIDEVHMLTTAAENAFLKTLEEPPEYAIFILATTDPQKVRATIRSRCMQLNFKRVSEDELVEGMARMCKSRGVEVTKDALGTIATKADGSVRDALSILEQCMAAGDTYIDKSLVLEYTGCAGEDFYLELTDNINNGNLGDALCNIDDIIKEGKDAKQILKDWLEHYRSLMISKYVDRADRIISASDENLARIKEQATSVDIRDIERGIRLMSEYINLGRYSDRPRILLETLAVRLASGEDVSYEAAPRPARPARAMNMERTAPSNNTNLAPKQAQVRTEEPKIEAKQNDEPVAMFTAPKQSQADLEADMLLARATTATGDANGMWQRLCTEMTKVQASFGIMSRNCQPQSFENNELTVIVKKNKISFIDKYKDDLERIAKTIFGASVYITLKPGEIDAKRNHSASSYETQEFFGNSEEPPMEAVSEAFEGSYAEDFAMQQEADLEADAAANVTEADAIASQLADTFGMKIDLID